jgi:hypothetical protein
MGFGVPQNLPGKGTKRQRNRRKQPPVPVPYAPTPKGRAAARAAGAYDRPAVSTTGSVKKGSSGSSLVDALTSVATSPAGTLLGGVDNPISSTTKSLVADEATNLAEVARRHYPAVFGDDPTLAAVQQPVDEKSLQAAATILAPVPVGNAGKALEAAQAIKASEKAAQEATAGAKAVRALAGKSPIRSAATKAAEKAEPAVVRAARQAAGRRAAEQAAKLPAPVRVAGKVAGKSVALPFKRPLTTPIIAQAPAFALSGGNVNELAKPFKGQGTLAAITGAVGDAGGGVLPGVAGNAFKDALDLPAVALPSTYIAGAGAVEAAQGRPQRLEGLWNQYLKTGVIPALLRADPQAALKAAEEHPLFTVLQASGGLALLGRGSGGLVRNLSKGHIGGTERPPVFIKGAEHYGNVNEILGRGRYSPDLIRQSMQRAYDKRRVETTGGPYATKKQAERIVRRDIPDRYAFEREQVRRLDRERIVKAMQGAEPRKNRFKIDKASADVVSLAVQKIIRTPETFYDDLRTYRSQLQDAAKSGEMTKNELAANNKLVKQVDRAIESANPEEVVKAANHFIEQHGKLVGNIVDQGLLDASQAERAALMPFARVHMGAGYEKGVGMVDRHGNLLPTEAIKAEMDRHGVEAPGFLTHQPRTDSARGAWYRAFFPERQSLSKKSRTGAAAARGTYDASYRALVEQAARSQSIVDATGGFDGLIRQFKIKPPKGVKDLGTAHAALLDPEKYGWDLPPDIKLRPIRTAPFLSLKRELQAAARHQDLLDPEAGKQLHDLAETTLRDAEEPGSGPVVYVPDQLYTRLLEHFQPSTSLEKAVQVGNTAFKGAVLPFSPSFYIGNFADNAMRTALAGIGPSDILLGRKVAKELPEAARESIQPGAMYGSFKRSQPYRDARQFEGTPLAGVARSLHAVRRTPGPKQVVTFFDRTRDFLLELNSRMFERLPQYGAIGKEARRELQAKSGYWHHALTVSDGAFKDLVKGLRGTDKQIQYAKAVEQVFGNWGKNGPAARGILANLVPFWQWGRASTRFVLMTLPAHHPIKTGLIAAAAEMTEDERKKFGLDQFADEPVPGFLQGNLPAGDTITKNLSKYTSFGSFGDYPEFIGKMFFAQGSSPLKALEGVDWKNDQLTKADGTPLGPTERAKFALLTGVEQFIPGVNLIEQTAAGELAGFSPIATEEKDKLDFLRSLSKSQQITVPAKGSGGGGSSSSGTDYGSVFSGGGSGVDYGSVFSGGN